MKLIQFVVSDSLSSVILYFIVLFANIDYSGIIDYGIKALVGSVIWFVFKLLGEYLLAKMKTKQSKKTINKKES